MDLGEIKPKHERVMSLLARGYELVDICNTYHLSYSTWSQIVKSDLFVEGLRKKVAELEDRELEDGDPAIKKLKDLQNKAVGVMEGALASEDEKIQLRAAEGILDRTNIAGAGVQSANITIVISDEKAKQLLEMIKKS